MIQYEIELSSFTVTSSSMSASGQPKLDFSILIKTYFCIRTCLEHKPSLDSLGRTTLKSQKRMISMLTSSYSQFYFHQSGQKLTRLKQVAPVSKFSVVSFVL